MHMYAFIHADMWYRMEVGTCQFSRAAAELWLFSRLMVVLHGKEGATHVHEKGGTWLYGVA